MKWSDTHHKRLHNRYEFRGMVAMGTALHVGTGQVSHATDAGVVRDFQGRPFIPGSSLKGAVRSAVERRAEWLRLRSCRLEKGYDDCLTTNKRPESQVGGRPWRQREAADRLSEMETGLCDVCKLFGSTVFGGKVQVDDLALADPFEALASQLVEVRDGVGIDRDTGTAADGSKFDYEVVPSLTAFQFYLTAENLTEADAALLSLGLLEMMNGRVPLGGKSTRGLGRCSLHLESVFHFKFPNGDPISMAEYLLDYLKPPEERTKGRVDDPGAFLEEQIRHFLEEKRHAEAIDKPLSD